LDDRWTAEAEGRLRKAEAELRAAVAALEEF
jgi:hypothetical protein